VLTGDDESLLGQQDVPVAICQVYVIVAGGHVKGVKLPRRDAFFLYQAIIHVFSAGGANEDVTDGLVRVVDDAQGGVRGLGQRRGVGGKRCCVQQSR